MPGTQDAVQFLILVKLQHMKAFAAALESMGKDWLYDARLRRRLARRISIS